MMKPIILRDPLKLDFYESLPGPHGSSILYKKAAGNMLLNTESHNTYLGELGCWKYFINIH